jgi:hypothetical protein
MSRVTFLAGHLEVVAGWDRPLQGFFLSIFSRYPSEEILYDSLEDPATLAGFMPDTGYFKAKLLEHGLSAPGGFWERVELREANVEHVFSSGIGS